jgi:hypothetical protein
MMVGALDYIGVPSLTPFPVGKRLSLVVIQRRKLLMMARLKSLIRLRLKRARHTRRRKFRVAGLYL